jgi:small subunit ribosomal protein S4
VPNQSRPKVKKSRALGIALTPKAVKYFEARPYPPGEHGRGRKQNSDYKVRLLEKQRLRAQYDISERQMARAYDRAKKAEGKTGEALVVELERRLDALVLRSGIAKTIYQARQMVVHGHIEVNGGKVDKPSFRVRPDDIVMVRERSREKYPFQVAREGGTTATPESAGVVLDDQLLVADDRDFLAVRVAVETEGQGLQVDLQVARGLALACVATLTGNLERNLLAAALAHGDDVVRTDTERRLVDLATVDLDVAVNDHLAGLVDGAGDARTQDQGVEATLELDDQRLARLAFGLLGAVVGASHLTLRDVVLGAQTLLLEQTNLVVRVLLAATAVLARRVGAGLEVLDGLRGQRNAEGTRLLDLGSLLVHVEPTSM